jgi:hypothetical protein
MHCYSPPFVPHALAISFSLAWSFNYTNNTADVTAVVQPNLISALELGYVAAFFYSYRWSIEILHMQLCRPVCAAVLGSTPADLLLLWASSTLSSPASGREWEPEATINYSSRVSHGTTWWPWPTQLSRQASTSTGEVESWNVGCQMARKAPYPWTFFSCPFLFMSAALLTG